MIALAREAHALLTEFPPSEARAALLNLVAFTVQRKK
jgi:geranylgeranyl pyrophosphate synthase